MRPRTLAVLAAVVGALLAILYFTGDKVASTDERTAAAKRLVDAKADDIVSIELEWQGAKVRFERDPAKAAVDSKLPATPGRPESPLASVLAGATEKRIWRIVEPFSKVADGAAVDRVVSELLTLESTRSLEGVAKKDVGLDPPRGRITWKSGATEGALEIGGSVPASHDIVVAASGRTAPAVTADTLLVELARPAGDWRTREVVTAARDKIDRVTLAPVTGAPVALARSGETLRMESPVADWLDRDLTDAVFSDLAALRMETFLDPPLAADVTAALATPAGAIEVGIAGESQPLRIEVGGERSPGKRVFRVGDQVFESASKIGDSIVRPALAWRSRSWTRFENWRIEKLRVEEAGGAFELRRANGEWLRDSQKIPFTAASDLLYAIVGIKSATISDASGAATPASRPVLTLTLSDADGNEEVLSLDAPPAPGAPSPAHTRGRNVVLPLAPSAVADLEAKIAVVRAAVPVPDAAAPTSPAAASASPAAASPPAP